MAYTFRASATTGLGSDTAKLYEQLQEADKTMRERKKTDEGKGTTLMATDVWGGLTGNGYRGNHSFMIHDDNEAAKTTTKQMPTGSWHSK